VEPGELENGLADKKPSTNIRTNKRKQACHFSFIRSFYSWMASSPSREHFQISGVYRTGSFKGVCQMLLRKLVYVFLMFGLVISACTAAVEPAPPDGGIPPAATLPSAATVPPAVPVPAETAVPAAQETGGLKGSSWELVSYGDAAAPTPAVSTSPARITFGADGRASGTGGCNSISGNYQQDGSRLTFSDLVSTMMACEQAVMDQESAVTAALTGKRDYSIAGDRLTIPYDESKALVWVKVQ
jgi:heat shock protein HslJ